MAVIRREGKRVGPLVRHLPQRHGVRLLVPRVHGLVDADLVGVVDALVRRGRHDAAGRRHLLVGIERRVLFLLVVDD